MQDSKREAIKVVSLLQLNGHFVYKYKHSSLIALVSFLIHYMSNIFLFSINNNWALICIFSVSFRVLDTLGRFRVVIIFYCDVV